jgi:hypothetical protein
MSEHYKGRTIDPRAYKLADWTGWLAKVCIAENVDSETTVDTPFSLIEIFPTKESAIQAAVEHGKQEVDKRIQSSEVQDIFDEANKLPALSRQPFGPSTNLGFNADLGSAKAGHSKPVPRPKTPDDPFRS